jgi:DNA polymerase IV
VVTSASYEARAHGVHAAMPLSLAARKCPEAAFLPSDADAYRRASREVMQVLETLPGALEPAGWDEAFLAASADDPIAFARSIQASVLEQTGLWCSVGIGENKLQAKIASGLGKPRGVFHLTRDNWNDVMAVRPPSALWGIGKKREKMLARLGVRTVAALASAHAADLAAEFGDSLGPQMRRLARGEYDDPVSEVRAPARSHGREITFERDVSDPEALDAELARLARRVAAEIAEQGRFARRIVVKVRYAPFDTHTHGVSLAAPATEPCLVERAAFAAFAVFPRDRPVRLLGVRAELA